MGKDMTKVMARIRAEIEAGHAISVAMPDFWVLIDLNQVTKSCFGATPEAYRFGPDIDPTQIIWAENDKLMLLLGDKLIDVSTCILTATGKNGYIADIWYCVENGIAMPMSCATC